MHCLYLGASLAEDGTPMSFGAIQKIAYTMLLVLVALASFGAV